MAKISPVVLLTWLIKITSYQRNKSEDPKAKLLNLPNFLMLVELGSQSLCRIVVLMTFDKLIILFSTNLDQLRFLLFLMVLKSFLKTLTLIAEVVLYLLLILELI